MSTDRNEKRQIKNLKAAQKSLLVKQDKEVEASKEEVRTMQMIMKYKPWEIPDSQIHEVVQLKRLFCNFFEQTTDFTQLFVPAKHENIYNIDEIHKNSHKSLIMKNTLNNKAVMMIEEGQSINIYSRYFSLEAKDSERYTMSHTRTHTQLMEQRNGIKDLR